MSTRCAMRRGACASRSGARASATSESPARSPSCGRPRGARSVSATIDVQLVGGRVLLGGLVAEMETGEGKTLTATLAAATAALAGIPVHVVTVNDYLAARDAEWMGPLYRALGLSVGHDRARAWTPRRGAPPTPAT